jgi:hypothetical protein
VTAAADRRLATIKGVTEVPLNMLPMLAHFRDLNDPDTIEPVRPDALDRTFGEGFRLARATVEVTAEPATRGLLGSLPAWFEEIRKKGSSLDGQVGTLRSPTAPLANRVGAGEFILGFDP